MTRLFTWFAADGTPSIVLNDRPNGYRLVQTGTTGFYAPTYRYTFDQYAGIDGSALQAVSADRRTVTLGMVIEAADELTFRARWRALARAMRPKAGSGVLQVRSEDGATRSLACLYLGGLEGDGADMFDGTQGRTVVTLTALDPWWYGDQVPIGFGLAAPSVFLSPTLPMPRALSSSSIQGQQVIDLTLSDAPSYPVWTVTGPGSVLTLTNNTTGRTIQINAALGDGQTMVIDTRPGFQSVRRGDLPSTDPAWNLGGSLASDPALWPLVEGLNTVTAMLGSAGANARISGVYRPRYAGI